MYTMPLMILTSLSSCSTKPPLVTLNQMDVQRNAILPWKVDKYNEKTCKMEGHKLDPMPLVVDGQANPVLQKGVFVSWEDYTKLIEYGKTECKNQKTLIEAQNKNAKD